MDATIAFAKKIVSLKYKDISAEALNVTRKHVLDQLATTIGGSTSPGCQELVELFKEWGGKEESTILVYGDRVPAPNAAEANAMMGHALEYDDTYDITGMHAGATTIPTAFAMAERSGKVSGKEFVTAVVLGLDVGYRMALAPNYKTDMWGEGWWNSQLFGYFAAAATAGKILGLSEEKMVNAFGIAYQQASGSIQCVYDGSLTKRMGPGFSARGGIVSGLMAEKGITGAQNSLEGNAGLFNVYFRGSYDPDVLIVDLGKRFEGANTSFKPYPSCRGNHSSIAATLELMNDHALKAEDVAEVVVFGGHIFRDFQFEPLEVKRNPRTVVDAQFSVPWVVATAIVHGKVTIKNFTPDGIKDSTVLQMAQKVSFKLDDSLTRRSSQPSIVEIRTNDGRLFSKTVDFVYGNPENPMSLEAIADKFKECASCAAKPIPKDNLEKVIEMVNRLENLDDVGSIVRLLS